jgi:hypothetical protein
MNNYFILGIGTRTCTQGTKLNILFIFKRWKIAPLGISIETVEVFFFL